VVYGMPMSVKKAGYSDFEITPDNCAQQILRMLQ
jgi:chemotaxis response regulator CheB